MSSHELDRLTHRVSRGGNRLAAAGALVFMMAFAYALLQFSRLEKELTEKRNELQKTVGLVKRLVAERDTLLMQNRSLRADRLQLKRINQELEESVRLQQNRDYLGAWRKLATVIQRDPENEVALCYAAHSAYQLGYFSNAVDFASRSIKLDASYLDPYPSLVCALNKSGRRSDAVASLDAILMQRPENFMLLVSRKRYFDEMWSIKETRDCLIRFETQLKEIQSALKRYGYYTCVECKIDGIFGAASQLAVQQFCHARGMTNTVSVTMLSQALGIGKHGR